MEWTRIKSRAEMTLSTSGEVRLSPQSFLVLERNRAKHGGGVKYVCIHGHFYQPPRENPYLEAIELQDSAYPYHDWNERITAECYAPNAASRILDSENRITKLLNNYAEISFNFGPTLLSWMKEQAPTVYQAILEADQQSAERFSGHGSAIAQGYNHMILPLANRRDKVTQVKWGMRDFESRFGRKPEGMWLPETAVDTETLEVWLKMGFSLRFSRRARPNEFEPKNSSKWEDVSGSRIDPARAYLAELPSKKRINLFFYDGPISQGVAFEGLLNDGKRFADRLMSGFSDSRQGPQLVHIATDGESYGHHHHRGEMALTTPWTKSKAASSPSSPITANSWKTSPPSTSLRSSIIVPGVVCMA